MAENSIKTTVFRYFHQDGRRRLSIPEQFMFPFVPLIELVKAKRSRMAVS